MRTIWQLTDLEFPIALKQDDEGMYIVEYGTETSYHLDYIAAAHEIGEAIMHALTCAGLTQ